MFFHYTHRHLHFLLPFSNSPAHSSTPDDFLIPMVNLIQQPNILFDVISWCAHSHLHYTTLISSLSPNNIYVVPCNFSPHSCFTSLWGSFSPIVFSYTTSWDHSHLSSYHVTPAYSATHHLVLPEGSYTKTRVAYFDVNWSCTFTTKWLSMRVKIRL